MSFKKKTSYHRHECEYTSADGETYDISLIKHGEKQYISWTMRVPKVEKLPNPDNPEIIEDKITYVTQDPITIDALMLDGLYKIYQEVFLQQHKESPRHNLSGSHLPRPKISDHRNVQDRHDDDEVPEQIKIGDIRQTPEEWSTDEVDQEWKQDAINRKKMPKADYNIHGTTRGDAGLKFRRVSPGDLM